MKCDRVEVVKQRVDRFGKTDHCDNSSDTRRNKDAHVKMSDPVHKWRIKSQRHEQCGKAHARRDHTERQTETAEQVPEEIRFYFNREHLKSDQQCEDHDHTDDH